MIYIANNQIMHNGKLFKPGQEVAGLKKNEIEYLLKDRSISQYGSKDADAEAKPAPAQD